MRLWEREIHHLEQQLWPIVRLRSSAQQQVHPASSVAAAAAIQQEDHANANVPGEEDVWGVLGV
jgi:hypothetical protein